MFNLALRVITADELATTDCSKANRMKLHINKRKLLHIAKINALCCTVNHSVLIVV